jgi:hypothetical protein
MLEDTEYMDITFLTNLCGNSNFDTTSGWSTSIFAENISFTKSAKEGGSYLPSNYKGEIEAGGSKKLYQQLVSASAAKNDFTFPADPLKYLSYSSPKNVGSFAQVYPVLISSGPYAQRTAIKNLKP